MKKPFLAVAAILICTVCSLTAQNSPTQNLICDLNQYQSVRTSDYRWNNLLITACREINSGHYETAYKLLVDAYNLDTKTTDGSPKEFVKTEIERIKKFLDHQEKAAADPAVIDDKSIAITASTDNSGYTGSSDGTLKKDDDAVDASGVRTFSEKEMNDFHVKGLEKISELEDLIKRIGDKISSTAIAEHSIENAMNLFDSDEHFVQVSSVNKAEKMKYPTRKYFERLRALNYQNVFIEWAEFQYTSDFILAPDSKYHGYIEFSQKFVATKDDIISYSDKTRKKVEVILMPYTKTVEGKETENWDIFLGDISVVQTGQK
ncbi:MAG: hypothetical protein ABIT08_12595 [Bacteroidia bacterium]